jgi:hypothetical protein
MRREIQKDRLVIIRGVHGTSVIDENAVRQLAAQGRFELMMMRVDKARHDDLAGRVDDRGIGGIDIDANRRNATVLDQNVAVSEIADSIVHGKRGAALDEDRSYALNEAIRNVCHGAGNS